MTNDSTTSNPEKIKMTVFCIFLYTFMTCITIFSVLCCLMQTPLINEKKPRSLLDLEVMVVHPIRACWH